MVAFASGDGGVAEVAVPVVFRRERRLEALHPEKGVEAASGAPLRSNVGAFHGLPAFLLTRIAMLAYGPTSVVPDGYVLRFTRSVITGVTGSTSQRKIQKRLRGHRARESSESVPAVPAGDVPVEEALDDDDDDDDGQDPSSNGAAEGRRLPGLRPLGARTAAGKKWRIPPLASSDRPITMPLACTCRDFYWQLAGGKFPQGAGWDIDIR